MIQYNDVLAVCDHNTVSDMLSSGEITI